MSGGEPRMRHTSAMRTSENAISAESQREAGREHRRADRDMAGSREHAAAAPDCQRAETNLQDQQEEQSERWPPKRRNIAMRPDDTCDRPQNHRSDDYRATSMSEIDR